ncbi:hypothetical protein I4F81_010382 [Pyropia yezoensis]|uniref:Uncharacterized protein n=1 Tax=Pyropia yezoensis TaxID=2788 RepID=A0ACC3CCC0_PYRYE|nr:hypothetical protein I4F81_010382 [Neopyropia yezoensis]
MGAGDGGHGCQWAGGGCDPPGQRRRTNDAMAPGEGGEKGSDPPSSDGQPVSGGRRRGGGRGGAEGEGRERNGSRVSPRQQRAAPSPASVAVARSLPGERRRGSATPAAGTRAATGGCRQRRPLPLPRAPPPTARAATPCRGRVCDRDGGGDARYAPANDAAGHDKNDNRTAPLAPRHTEGCAGLHPPPALGLSQLPPAPCSASAVDGAPPPLATPLRGSTGGQADATPTSAAAVDRVKLRRGGEGAAGATHRPKRGVGDPPPTSTANPPPTPSPPPRSPEAAGGRSGACPSATAPDQPTITANRRRGRCRWRQCR